MSKITARDIQMFVGGALAITGFQSLCHLPYLFHDFEGGVIVLVALADFAWAIALPIGIGVLLKKERAIRWAYIFIWAFLILVLLDLVFAHPSSDPSIPPWWRRIENLPVPVALLWLLSLARSKRSKNDQIPPKELET